MNDEDVGVAFLSSMASTSDGRYKAGDKMSHAACWAVGQPRKSGEVGQQMGYVQACCLGQRGRIQRSNALKDPR